MGGRCLHDNFVSVRQSARFLHQLKLPHALLKLDLTKAFNSISWAFVLQVLRRIGFGERFCGWLCILCSSASTRVMINGAPGALIWHRKGQWQGDPLPPQIFVLTVDALRRLVCRALDFDFLQPLHPRRQIPVVSLYADDVVVLCHPSRQDLDTIKGLLSMFGQALGLSPTF